MAMLQRCRVCLSDNVNLCSVNNIHLTNVYEKLTDSKYNKFGYPISMCYICLAVLKKCHKFMETARDTNNVLEQWYNKQTKLFHHEFNSISKELDTSIIVDLEITVSKPLSTLSVFKIDDVSVGNENINLGHVINTKEVELASDYIECETETDKDSEKTGMEELTENNSSSIVDMEQLAGKNSSLIVDMEQQAENNSSLFVHSPYANPMTIDLTDERQVDPLSNNNMDFEEMSRLTSNVDGPLDNEIETTNPILTQHNIEIETSDESSISYVINTMIKMEEIEENNVDIFVADDVSHPTETSNSDVDSTPKAQKHKVDSTPKAKKSKVDSTPKAQKPKVVLTPKAKKRKVDSTPKVQKSKVDSAPKAQKPKVDSTTKAQTPKNKKTTSKIKSNTKKVFRQEGDKYICNVCPYKCRTKFMIIRHSRIHTGEKPFTCNFCEYRCAEKSNLKTHLRKHTGEKPFSCHYCDYRCAASFNMKMHERIHKNEKTFSCHICEYKCIEKSNLKTHLRIHTGDKPFKCEICSSTFATNSHLKLHLKIHDENGKPYACEYCEFTGLLKSNLIEHLRIHTGERPFKCKICGKTFKRRTHLRGHIEKLHPYFVEGLKGKRVK